MFPMLLMFPLSILLHTDPNVLFRIAQVPPVLIWINCNIPPNHVFVIITSHSHSLNRWQWGEVNDWTTVVWGPQAEGTHWYPHWVDQRRARQWPHHCQAHRGGPVRWDGLPQTHWLVLFFSIFFSSSFYLILFLPISFISSSSSISFFYFFIFFHFFLLFLHFLCILILSSIPSSSSCSTSFSFFFIFLFLFFFGFI